MLFLFQVLPGSSYKSIFCIETRKPIYGFLRFLLLVLRFLHRNLTFFMWET